MHTHTCTYLPTQNHKSNHSYTPHVRSRSVPFWSTPAARRSSCVEYLRGDVVRRTQHRVHTFTWCENFWETEVDEFDGCVLPPVCQHQIFELCVCVCVCVYMFRGEWCQLVWWLRAFCTHKHTTDTNNHIYTHFHTYQHLKANLQSYTYVCMYHMCVRIWVCTCIYIHTHTYMYIYAHVRGSHLQVSMGYFSIVTICHGVYYLPVCMYVRMYVSYVHMYIHVSTIAWMFCMCIHVHIFESICSQHSASCCEWVSEWVCVCVHACVYKYMHEYICIYICMYIYIYIYTYIHTHNLHLNTHTHKYKGTVLQSYIQLYIHAHTHARARAYTHTHMHTYKHFTHNCIRIYTHPTNTYIHTHTQTQENARRPPSSPGYVLATISITLAFNDACVRACVCVHEFVTYTHLVIHTHTHT
jgi:hypothetical protein